MEILNRLSIKLAKSLIILNNQNLDNVTFLFKKFRYNSNEYMLSRWTINLKAKSIILAHDDYMIAACDGDNWLKYLKVIYDTCGDVGYQKSIRDTLNKYEYRGDTY